MYLGEKKNQTHYIYCTRDALIWQQKSSFMTPDRLRVPIALFNPMLKWLYTKGTSMWCSVVLVADLEWGWEAVEGPYNFFKLFVLKQLFADRWDWEYAKIDFKFKWNTCCDLSQNINLWLSLDFCYSCQGSYK